MIEESTSNITVESIREAMDALRDRSDAQREARMARVNLLSDWMDSLPEEHRATLRESRAWPVLFHAYCEGVILSPRQERDVSEIWLHTFAGVSLPPFLHTPASDYCRVPGCGCGGDRSHP